MTSLEASSEPAAFDRSEVLLFFDAAIDENAEWLQNWHRAVICGEIPGRRTVSKYAVYVS